MDFILRVFNEKPLFNIPRGLPILNGEEVRFPSSDGLMLSGCYVRTASDTRRGIILFGLEFGSNRWSCAPYCEGLIENGFDVFAFEFRGQGDSDAQPGYEPRQWVTDYEVADTLAALAYLKARPDGDPRGVGFFGISKGGGAGIIVGAVDDYIRCFVTDGIFATRDTMIPYMRKWVAIVSKRFWLQNILPNWYYGLLADAGLRRAHRDSGRDFPSLEAAVGQISPRPLLMIHGTADTYIKPDMAAALFARARSPKELWLVEKAKHNQALHVANGDYRRRVLEFFETHLTGEPIDPRKLAAANGDVLVQKKHAPRPLSRRHAPISKGS
jgi:fermentation-respiration switch protein FrsA (DUF1100 family)